MPMEFNYTFKQVGEALEENLDKVLKASVMDMAESIVEKTPVLTGFARASWWTYIGAKSPNPAQPVAGPVVPFNPGAAIALPLTQAKFGTRVTLANNADYIDKLEYGSSRKAPQGMVRISLPAWPQIVEANVRKYLTLRMGGPQPQLGSMSGGTKSAASNVRASRGGRRKIRNNRRP